MAQESMKENRMGLANEAKYARMTLGRNARARGILSVRI